MSLNTLQVTSVLSFFASCFYMHERITMLLCFVHRTLYMPCHNRTAAAETLSSIDHVRSSGDDDDVFSKYLGNCTMYQCRDTIMSGDAHILHTSINASKSTMVSRLNQCMPQQELFIKIQQVFSNVFRFCRIYARG
jgi:hypothetical protein